MNFRLDTVLSNHRGDINACDFGPRERFATASSDHDVRIWDYNAKLGRFAEASSISPIVHHAYRYNEEQESTR